MAPGARRVEIVTREEVTADEIFAVKQLAFGDFLSPEALAKRKRLDERYRGMVERYAREDGRMVGQVTSLHIPTLTREGPWTVAGIAGVATHPAYMRRGVARALTEAVHEALLAEGLDLSFLLTGNMAAYGLYHGLGYRDFALFPRAIKRVGRKRAPPASRLRKARKGDLDRLDAIHRAHTRDLLGFVSRQEGFYRVWVQTGLDLKDIQVLERDGRPVAYGLVEERQGAVLCFEAAARTARDYAALMAHLEAKPKVLRVVVYPSTVARNQDRLARRGYKLEPVSYGRSMALDLTGKRDIREIRLLYGVDEGRFCLMAGDDF